MAVSGNVPHPQAGRKSNLAYVVLPSSPTNNSIAGTTGTPGRGVLRLTLDPLRLDCDETKPMPHIVFIGWCFGGIAQTATANQVLIGAHSADPSTEQN